MLLLSPFCVLDRKVPDRGAVEAIVSRVPDLYVGLMTSVQLEAVEPKAFEGKNRGFRKIRRSLHGPNVEIAIRRPLGVADGPTQ